MKPSKLKPPIFVIITAILIVIVGSIIFIFSEIGLLSKETAWIFTVVIFTHAIFDNVIRLIKTKNMAFLSTILLFSDIAAINLLFALHINKDYWTVPLGTGFFIFAIFSFYISFSKKIKPRYRQVLELAAKPIDGTADGFTPRPFSVGHASYSKEEIVGFARYLTKKLVAINYFEKDSIFLVIQTSELSYIRLLKPSIQNQTYVCFDYSGKVTVNIAKKDYKKYKQELTFDQLCESLGNLFKSFLDHYKKGETEKIITMFEKRHSNE